MHTAPKLLPCPHCGRTDAKPIDKQLNYLPGMGPWNSQPISTMFTYQCQCGMGFTHSIKHSPPPSEAAKQ